MQIICTSLHTDNHASTLPLSFLQAGCFPAAQPTASKHCTNATVAIPKSDTFQTNICWVSWTKPICYICKNELLVLLLCNFHLLVTSALTLVTGSIRKGIWLVKMLLVQLKISVDVCWWSTVTLHMCFPGCTVSRYIHWRTSSSSSLLQTTKLVPCLARLM